MGRLLRRFARLAQEESGPTAVEYAVLLGLILVVALVAIQSLGGGVGGKWQSNADRIIQAMSQVSG